MNVTLNDRYTFEDWRQGFQYYVTHVRNNRAHRIPIDIRLNFGEIQLQYSETERRYFFYGVPPAEPKPPKFPSDQFIISTDETDITTVERNLLLFSETSTERCLIMACKGFTHLDTAKAVGIDANLIFWEDAFGNLQIFCNGHAVSDKEEIAKAQETRS